MKDDESEVVKNIASLSAAMVSAGTGGLVFKEAMSCYQQIVEGRDWITVYESARTPPPDPRLGYIEELSLDWLKG